MMEIVSGSNGIIYVRTNVTPIREGIPKMTPVLISICQDLYLGITANKLVSPTNHNEYDVAKTGSILKI